MRAHGLKDRDVARRSRGFLSHTSVNTIRNGEARDPKWSTFQGVAYGLGVPLEVVLSAAAGKPLIEGGNVKLLQAGLYFKHLPEEKQDDALMHLRGLFIKYGENIDDVVRLTRNLARRKAS